LAGRPEAEILALEPKHGAVTLTKAYLRARGRTAKFEIPELGLEKGSLPRVLPLRGGRELLFAFSAREGDPRKGKGIHGFLISRQAVLKELRDLRPIERKGALVSSLLASPSKFREAVAVLPGISLIPDFPKEELGGLLQFLFLLAGAILILGIVLASRSLSKERRAFIQREDFLRAATHELKTPLASLHLLLESLVSGRISEPEKRNEYLRLLQGETERLSSLVGQTLDFRQVEQKALDVACRPLPLGPFLEEMTRLYIPQLEREKRGLRLQMEEELMVFTDPSLFRRVLWNLLENARLHGLGWVSLMAERRGEWVSLLVEDEGEGLEERAWDRVFEPFARGPGAGEGRVPGMGLGLAFVRRIIQAMGGKCCILPSEKGFRIQVLLPHTKEPA
jgi:signal transduction histidine kinase